MNSQQLLSQNTRTQFSKKTHISYSNLVTKKGLSSFCAKLN